MTGGDRNHDQPQDRPHDRLQDQAPAGSGISVRDGKGRLWNHCFVWYLYYNKTQKIPGFELNREISRNPCPRLNPWYSMIMIRTKRWFKNYAIRAVLHSCDVLQEKKNDRQCVWWSCDLVVATMIVWFRKGALLDFLIKHNEFQTSQHWELWSC